MAHFASRSFGECKGTHTYIFRETVSSSSYTVAVTTNVQCQNFNLDLIAPWLMGIKDDTKLRTILQYFVFCAEGQIIIRIKG